MQVPNIMYNANVVLPQPAGTHEYELKVVLEALAPFPGIGRVVSFTGGYIQLKTMSQKLNLADQLGDRVMIVLEMGSTVVLIGLAVLNPRAGAIVSGFARAFSSMSAFIDHLERDPSIQTLALDVFRTGSNVVYMWAMISGNPVFIALSLVMQGGENFIEGGSMLIKQWNQRDWVVVGLATMQMGFGAVRCFQGSLLGFTYGLARADQPQMRCLDEDQGLN